jgi:tRNA uridine 5-carbamoylmethylation protein Kti12
MYSGGLRVVIVNGKPGAGKTTFENLCKDIIGRAFVDGRSTVDRVKEIAAEIGWHGVKDLKSRKLLSDLKDIFTEYNDLPFKDVCQHLRHWEEVLIYYGVANHPHIFFIDDREPEHISRLKKELNAVTVLIRRPGDEDTETSNHADQKVFEYEYDYVINNDGTLDDLQESAERFINSLFS